MPIIDPLSVIAGCLVPNGQVKASDLGFWVAQHLITDCTAQFCKIGFSFALVRDQDQILRIDRADRLQGQVFGIACANADEGEFLHRCYPGIRAIARVRSSPSTRASANVPSSEAS